MTWKDTLAGRIPVELAQEIDVYETQLELRKLGKIDEKLFAETRLRRGAYGQRYDNGQRHDGIKTQHLNYPSGTLTKGPDTMWDAPGMQRIKIPFGGLTAEQMEMLADVAEEYADGILHVTTRQDFQLHFVHIDDTPTIMRRLASVGITTREACGNAVRNVTACPLAGACHTEAFDVTPYAKALSRFLLGHPDTQDFGRKFKPAFSGCEQEACGLVTMHDLGAIAQIRDGQRGFKLFVGGGLGPVPYQAKVFAEFLPEEELLPIAQAIARVFARLGEKQNRSRARIKFLVAKLGIDEFRRLVLEERQILPHDPRWTAYLPQAHEFAEKPCKLASSLNPAGAGHPEGFDAWVNTNVYRQRQPGYAVATVTLPIGDITAWQMRQLADLARKFSGDNIRTTVEQNIVLRWITEADLPALYRELKKIGLGEHGAGTILDVVACPGTDTCKLGIASSRGLAREIRGRLAEKFFTLDKAVQGLRIKMSGCFNSCGQHHVADIGFYGNSRTIGKHKVPHFQVLLGGKWKDNAGSYGLAIGSVPSKRVPDVVDRITQRFVDGRQGNESFQEFITRIGKAESRKMLEDLMEVPPYENDPSFYSDWDDPREFTMGDMGVGECAGEVVSRLDFDLQAAERLCFEAQLKLEAKDLANADALAYQSMLQAAHALVKELWYDVPADPDAIAKEFRTRLYEPKLFWDRFVGGKFAQDFLQRHENPPTRLDPDEIHRLVQEAQLFIDASHACADKLREQKAANLKL
ncbi:MAG TPA: nitrite/sulfite reductase [Verrucomicrobiae bacterium]|nr:nitrite/sulfite reductase [Verrucomicrobiae bacterium]